MDFKLESIQNQGPNQYFHINILSMKQYSIPFDFKGKHYIADVTEIDGLDNTEYAISARDEALATIYKTNVIQIDKDDENWHYGLPASADGDEYMKSLASGLRAHLSKETH